MSSNNIVQITRSFFARDSIILLRLIIFIQLLFSASLVVFIFFQYQYQPKPVYFPLKHSDQLIDSIPLERPSLTEAELLNWVTEAMIVSFSFNYYNYNKITNIITDYFDPLGQASYAKMISENKQIQQLVDLKLILSGRPTGAPRIVKDGVVDGVYAWEVNVPFILKFRNQELSQNVELTLDLFVIRVPEKTAPLGVKIMQIQELKS